MRCNLFGTIKKGAIYRLIGNFVLSHRCGRLFREATQVKKAIAYALVTTVALGKNEHSGTVQSVPRVALLAGGVQPELACLHFLGEQPVCRRKAVEKAELDGNPHS